jgi:hypothetical protein
LSQAAGQSAVRERPQQCRARKLDANRAFVLEWSLWHDKGLTAPAGMTLDPDGSLRVADAGNHRVQVFALDVLAVTDANALTLTRDGTVLLSTQ